MDKIQSEFSLKRNDYAKLKNTDLKIYKAFLEIDTKNNKLLVNIFVGILTAVIFSSFLVDIFKFFKAVERGWSGVTIMTDALVLGLVLIFAGYVIYTVRRLLRNQQDMVWITLELDLRQQVMGNGVRTYRRRGRKRR
ncbi:hypothetical protein AB9M75_00450 [Lactobacillus sp. AN1001]